MTIYRKENGYYYTHFTLKGKQVHRKLNTKNKNEAVALEAKLRADFFKAIELGDTSFLVSVTLSELITMYQKQSELDNKKSRDTDNSRFKVINSFFKPLTKIKNITVSDIEKFKEYLLEEKQVSTTTVNRYLELLSALFSYAMKHDYIKENICRKIKKYTQKNYKVRYLSDEEEKRLFEHLSEHIKPIVRCALITGLRKSNILNLQRKQIDFRKNTIEVLDNKGNDYLIIPIADKYRDELIQLCEGIDNDDYLFKNPDTGLPYVDISKPFNRALTLANISDFRFHDLRHTFATRLVMAGVPIVTVKALMGHKNINTTLRYAHATDESKRNAINLI